MLSLGLVAIDATILATAVPSIVNDLGGFSQFPWLFSIYLLAQAVTVPIYGKFADLFGRKPIILLGIALFVVGSVLCGFAWNMGSMIVFRAIQGLGAGAIIPTSSTIVGDIYSIAERSRIQGYLASVWALSAIFGTTLGGLLSDYLSWRWIFFINIPVAIAAAAILLRSYDENHLHRKRSIDFAGAALLSVGCSLLVIGLLEGGIQWAWGSATSMSIFASSAVLLVAFAFVERRVKEPILPPWIFQHRVLNGTSAAALGVGVLLVGLSSYVPLYVQTVLGRSALVGGLTVAGISLGWPIAASFAGKFYLRIGFRDTALIGTVFVIAGSAVLLGVTPQSSVYHLAAACFVIGLGLGFIASPVLIAAQSAVGKQNRGVVTGANMFARSMGSAVGIAAFGAIANTVVTRRSGSGPAELELVSPTTLDPAIHSVYIAAACFGIFLIIAVLIVPRRFTSINI